MSKSQTFKNRLADLTTRLKSNRELIVNDQNKNWCSKTSNYVIRVNWKSDLGRIR